jgi:glycosyltransferase involved in cell wall biosynthesis
VKYWDEACGVSDEITEFCDLVAKNRMHDSTKKPIEVVFYEPYPMGIGGNFKTQLLILERLDPKLFHPIVVAPLEGVALDRYRALGIECIVMPPRGQLGKYGGAILRTGLWRRMESALDLLQYNLQMARLFRTRRVDLIYANCVRAQMSIGFAALLTAVPTILYVKGVLANPIIDRLCIIMASRILFFCEKNRDDKYPLLVRWLQRKISILPTGLDPTAIAEAQRRNHSDLREELDISPNRLNTVVLGQLYEPKGQHLAIEALSRLISDFPDVRLYFVGDHVIDEYRQYKSKLENLIAERGLTEHVRFTGWRRDALDILSLMDTVIHPSLAEGFGRAILESMALGKPVIASAVGAVREAIQDGRNGYLVSPGDVEAIARKWRGLLSDPELRARLGREARETVFANYLIDDKVKRLSEIWTQMVVEKT